jgi:hypothetical protein
MSLEFLKNITNDFSKERELGSGTFGKVYKASKKNDDYICLTATFCLINIVLFT